MTDDDERMDRARRIREMREGSRPQDDASNDDQPADDSEADTAEESGADAADESADGAADESATDEVDEPDVDDASESTDGGQAAETSTADTAADATDESEDVPAETDEAPAGDDESESAEVDAESEADDAGVDGAEPDGVGVDGAEPDGSESGESGDAAATAAEAAAEAAAELQETEDGGTIHIPGAEVGDVEVDVEEMAEQAGLSPSEDGEADDDVNPVAAGAAGRAEDAGTQRGEETRVLEFALGDEQYCLDIEYVEEIVKRETVTRVPNTAECVEGVVDLRGQITTILDPKVLLDIPEEGSKDLIVVFDPDEFDDQGAVGWVVDDVNQVTPVTEDEVNPSPVDQDHVNGVVDRDDEFVIWTTPELDLDEAAG